MIREEIAKELQLYQQEKARVITILNRLDGYISAHESTLKKFVFGIETKVEEAVAPAAEKPVAPPVV